MTAVIKPDHKAAHIITVSGKTINPLAPCWRDVDINDIAHSLSNQCRFTGHTAVFYSVAQHSCLVSDNLPRALALEGLLHDASEAYLSDLARPIKQQRGLGEVYLKVEQRLMEAISDAFGLDYSSSGMHLEIKAVDNMLLRTEIRDLMPISDFWSIDWSGEEPLRTRIKTWSPSRSKQEFLSRFKELYK